MENVETRREIDLLKKHVAWLDDEVRKTLSNLYTLEEKIMDEEEDSWKKIGLNAGWLSGLSSFLTTQK